MTSKTDQMNALAAVDPGWAWAPYDPSDSMSEQPTSESANVEWNLGTAAHLFRRAGFGADAKRLRSAVEHPPADVVAELLGANLETGEFRATADALAKTIVAAGDPAKLSAAWVYRLLYTPAQLLEKMTLFWHGHFATGADKVENAEMMWRQNQLLRQHALGDFRELTQGIAKDPAMLLYLDSASNRKAHPNENFARELMELFCLGEGNYSERDVLELARCFTGWEIRNERFRKNRYQHDMGEKTVLGQRGNFDGEDGVEIVVAHPETERFLAAKFFRFFICDEPEPPESLLEPLAETLRENNLRIAPAIQQLFSSNLFFSSHAIARKIKSPVELVVGFLRGLNVTANTELVANGLRDVGQGLFYPPNVKGWDGGRAWINSSTLLGRANLLHKIIFDSNTRFGDGTLSESLAAQGIDTPEQAVEHFAAVLVAIPIREDSKAKLVHAFSATPTDREQSFRKLLHGVVSLPEIQLG